MNSSEFPVPPPSVPTENLSVFEGKHDAICQARRYCDSLDCKKSFMSSLRVFWYHDDATASVSRAPSNSIQQKMKRFLSTLEACALMGNCEFVQFWTPITTEGGKAVLSVSKQPFGILKSLKGLCRYRYYCLDYCSNGRTEIGRNFGPVGSAFTRGSPELCPNINVNQKEFKNQVTEHFKHCGICGYLTLPLFELGGGPCIGVLEFVSIHAYFFSSRDTWKFLAKLKEVGLAFRYPSHSEILAQIQPYFNECEEDKSVQDLLGKTYQIQAWLPSVMDLVMKTYCLTLIRIWLPCICKGSEVFFACDPNSRKASHLVCGLQCFDKIAWRTNGYFCYDTQVHFLEDGESWVGGAHAQRKICFIKDIKKYNIWDYPRVTRVFLSLSSIDPVLSACFAIPLQLVHPELPPLVLEVFLPYAYENHGPILNQLLSMFARELSKCNSDFGLKQGEEYCIETSRVEDSNDCIYYHVYRYCDASEREHLPVATKENMRPCHVPSQGALSTDDSTRKRKLPSSDTSPLPQRNHAILAQQTAEFATISVNSSDEEQPSGLRYNPSDYSEETVEVAARVPLPIPVEIPALFAQQTKSVDSSEEDRQSDRRYNPSDNSEERAEEAARVPLPTPVKNSASNNGKEASISEAGHGAFIPSTNGKGKNTGTFYNEVEIPASNNGREASIGPEYDKVGHGSSNNGREASIEPEYDEVGRGAFIPSTTGNGKVTETFYEEVDHGNGRNVVPKYHEADCSCAMIVKARYEDDIVKFPFSSSSGIEGLRRDLLTRFELERQRIKIKYQDGGEWFLLSCSEDLSFHMCDLKSSGQTTMDLSVFLIT